MQIIRVHDSGRTPANWTEMIRPGQFVAFPSDVASGLPCDAGGRPSADPMKAVCVLFDTLEDAEAWARKTVAEVPSVRFDVFDADGRVQPPVVTIVHPSRAASLDADPTAHRRRRAIAWTLIAAGASLIVGAYRERDTGDLGVIFFAFIGINMVLIAARLLWMNLIVRERERAREARVADRRRPSRPPAPQ